MSASKNRPRWTELPARVQQEIQRFAGAPVRSAANCSGGYSPGFASLLTLSDDRQVFAKAINGIEWPSQVDSYRSEARTAATLPAAVPSPAFLGTAETGGWVVLVFEAVPGAAPREPWHPVQLQRVLAAIEPHKAPAHLPGDHPRLGGWHASSASQHATQLADTFPWAATNLPLLAELEAYGLEVAKGDLLVHHDLYPHNILLTDEAVYFVDWPHARRGTPAVDVIAVLSTAAWHGIDPEPFVRTHPLTADLDVRAVDGLLAAHAGFCIAGTLGELPPGMGPIRDYKLGLGRASLAWLERRIKQR